MSAADEQNACRVVDVDGQPVRVQWSGEMTDQDREAFAELVRAVQRRMAEKKLPLGAPQTDGSPAPARGGSAGGRRQPAKSLRGAPPAEKGGAGHTTDGSASPLGPPPESCALCGIELAQPISHVLAVDGEERPVCGRCDAMEGDG